MNGLNVNSAQGAWLTRYDLLSWRAGAIIDGLFFVVAPLILLLQVYRYRRSSTVVQRQQTKWVVYGLLLGIGTYVALLLLPVVSTFSNPLNLVNNILLITVIQPALSFIPVSVGMAILRAGHGTSISSSAGRCDMLCRPAYWRPLGMGFLTGKLSADTKFDSAAASIQIQGDCYPQAQETRTGL